MRVLYAAIMLISLSLLTSALAQDVSIFKDILCATPKVIKITYAHVDCPHGVTKSTSKLQRDGNRVLTLTCT